MKREDYLERILRARVYDVAIESPLDLAPALSKRLGNRLLLKREDLQAVFSFKLRGAYNKMANLSRDKLKRGVIAASAGNHAQGVALAAQKLGCRAFIVMPVTAPKIKVDAVAARGAKVVLHGDSYDEAYAHAMKLKRRLGLAFVHPYDDPDVIAGQGTIGMEILRQSEKPIDAVFVAVGGGGLISGIASYLKHLRPGIKVIGVEPRDADAMARSLKAGRRVKLEHVGLFADGVAVREVGKETFRLCRKLVDDMVLVDTDEMCAAIKDVFEDTRVVLEPAGALAIAGAKAWVAKTGARGKTLVAVASGANTNFDRLRFVAEQAELGEAIKFGLLFGVVGFSIYGLAPNSYAFWSGIPVMALWGLAGAATMGIMSRLVGASEQGQLQGANSSLVAVAGLFGPGLFTFVFARVIADGSGWNLPGAPFLLAAALLFAATLLAWQLTRGKGAAPAT